MLVVSFLCEDLEGWIIPDQVAVGGSIIRIVRIGQDEVHKSAVFWSSGIGEKVGDLESGGPLTFGGACKCRASGQNYDGDDGRHSSN